MWVLGKDHFCGNPEHRVEFVLEFVLPVTLYTVALAEVLALRGAL